MDCTSLTSVTIGSGVIGAEAFIGCTGLTSVTIGSGVTNIGTSAFDGCTSLTSVAIGSGVTMIGEFAFDRCTSLTSVTIPDSVTSIGSGAFWDCFSLTNVCFEGNEPSDGGDVFNGTDLSVVYYVTGATGWGATFSGKNTAPCAQCAGTATITLRASPADEGTVSGSGTFAIGSVQTVNATPNNGYTMTNWTENGNVVSTSISYTFTVASDVTLVANFTPDLSTITVNANPASGGTVTGSGTYTVGSHEQISATAAMFYVFAGWSDGNTANPRTITVPSGGATYTANFSPTAAISFYHEPGGNGVNVNGHAFLSIQWKNGDSQFYGFYPASWQNEILGLTPGMIARNQPNWDFNISYPITVAQYASAATVITYDTINPPRYSLITFNCMNWVAKIANAAGVELPAVRNHYGIADPSIFGASLANIGEGNTYDGGLVTGYKLQDPPTPFDYSYGGLESAGHTNAASLATLIGLAYDPINLGTVNANSTNGISLTLASPNTNQDLISMNWGDGSAYQEQSLAFSHVYASGTYQANLLVVDAGAVHSYDMTVNVSSSHAASITFNVTPFPPANIPNQGLVRANPVPDFNVVQTTSIVVLPNGHAVVNFLGVATWTYTIEATADLTQGFLPVGSATAGADGTFEYNDPAALNFNTRFYRASYP